MAAGDVAAPDADVAADMYEWAEERLERAGFHQYELSNWALAGQESRHNLAYWTDRPYLGVGAGAHGYLDGAGCEDRVRYENIAHPPAYIGAMRGAAALSAFGTAAVASWQRPDRTTGMFDWLETHLRLVDGFDPALFAARFGERLDSAAGAPLRSSVEDGLISWDEGRVCLSARGRLLHSEVCARLLAHLQAAAPISR